MSSLHQDAQRNKKTRLGGPKPKARPYLKSIVATTAVVGGKKVTSYATVRVVQSRVVG